MLYIIGVNHRVQSIGEAAELTEMQKAFAECVKRVVRDGHPVLIAEEHSQEALAELGKHRSIAKEVADQHHIEHRFCDPNPEQREAMGYRDAQSLSLEIFMNDNDGLSTVEIDAKGCAIEMANHFPQREQFWLERLNGYEGDALFICGDGHVETFGKLLETKGIQFKVVERGIGVTDEDRQRFQRALDYLQQHPEIKTTAAEIDDEQ